jgi:hypothetical protein
MVDAHREEPTGPVQTPGRGGPGVETPAEAIPGPVRIVVTRWKCPHCNRGWSAKGWAARHIDRCWHNPAARGCKTCKHFDMDYDGYEVCGMGVDLTGSPQCARCGGMGDIPAGSIHDGTLAASCCPECGGDGGTNGPQRKPGPIVHCDLWEGSRG